MIKPMKIIKTIQIMFFARSLSFFSFISYMFLHHKSHLNISLFLFVPVIKEDHIYHFFYVVHVLLWKSWWLTKPILARNLRPLQNMITKQKDNCSGCKDIISRHTYHTGIHYCYANIMNSTIAMAIIYKHIYLQENKPKTKWNQIYKYKMTWRNIIINQFWNYI